VDGPAAVGKLRWTGETENTVDEVLSRKPERKTRDTSEMTRAVIDFVDQCGRPVALAEIYAQFPMARQDALRQTLKRAADRGELSNPLRGHYGPPDRA
jgi:hypothetical protein